MFFISGRTYPTFPESDDDDDDDDDDVAIIEDFDGKMDSLRQMFSIKPDQEIKSALLDATGDVEKAIDILVAPPGKHCYVFFQLLNFLYYLCIFSKAMKIRMIWWREGCRK